jgi:hypothetical protein
MGKLRARAVYLSSKSADQESQLLIAGISLRDCATDAADKPGEARAG